MPAIAIVAPDGTVTDVVMGDRLDYDLPVLRDRFPNSQIIVVHGGIYLSRGDRYDGKNLIRSAPPFISKQVDF